MHVSSLTGIVGGGGELAYLEIVLVSLWCKALLNRLTDSYSGLEA